MYNVRVVRYCGYFLATLVVLFAILWHSIRFLSPYIDVVRPSIERFLSQQLESTVTLGGIRASWSGPELRVFLDNITVADPLAEPVLSANQADLSLDVLSSLLRFKWVWTRIAVAEIAVDVEQDTAGQWRVAGAPLGGGGSAGPWSEYEPAKWLANAPHMELTQAHVRFTLANKQSWVLDIPTVELKGEAAFRRLTASARMLDREVLTFVVEQQVAGEQADKMTGWLQLTQFPLEEIATAVANLEKPVAGKGDQAAALDLSLWFGLSNTNSLEFMGSMASTAASPLLADHQPLLDLPMTSDIVGYFGADRGWAFGLRDFVLGEDYKIPQLQLSQARPQQAVQLAVESLEVQPWLHWAVSHFMNEKMPLLEALAAQGDVNNLVLEVDANDWQQSRLFANVTNASINAMNNIPGLKNVNGYVETNAKQGFFNLRTKNFHLSPRQLYTQPLVFDQVASQIAWQLRPEDNRILVNSGLIHAESEFGQAGAYFLLDIPWTRGSRSGEFILQLGLKNSAARYHQQLTPDKKIPERLRTWLSDSVGQGTVTQAGLIYRGGASNTRDGRTVQLFVDVDEAELTYSSEWPRVTDVQGQLRVDNTNVVVDADKLNILGERVNKVSVAWPGEGDRLLKLKAAGELSAKSGLRLLNEGGLRSVVGDTFTQWQIEGRVEVAVDLALPLFDSGSVPDAKIEALTKHDVTIGFNNNTIDLQQQQLRLAAVKGDLFYSKQEGLRAKPLNMRVFNQPLALNIQQKSSDQKDYLSLQGNSSVAVSDLVDWLQSPELSLLDGSLDYAMKLRIPLDRQAAYIARLSLSSNLAGVDINLPTPLGKTKDQLRPMELVTTVEKEGVYHRLSLGDNIHGAIANTAKKQSGFLAVNKPAVVLNDIPDKTFSLVAAMDKVVVDQWLAALSRYQEKRGQLSVANQDSKNTLSKLRYDLSIEHLQLKDSQLQDITLAGTRTGHRWRLAVKNPVLQGDVVLDDTFSEPIKIALGYLRLPKSENGDKAAVDPWSDLDVDLFKSARVSIDKLFYDGKPLGHWMFALDPIEGGVDVHDIYGNFSGLSLRGMQEGNGARLIWRKGAKKVAGRSQFSGRLLGGGIQHLFDDWGIEPLLKSKTTDVQGDVVWSGSPAFFSVSRLQGDVLVEMKDGLFVQNEGQTGGGVLRLFGLFNFDTWARRIRLDFSDLYKKGIVFDRLSSRLIFEDGWIYFQEPLRLQSPSSEFNLAGRINYPEESIDTVLVVTLPVGGNLTLAAALTGGLPAAAGVYLVRKLFPQVDKASSITYQINGSWDDPEVKPINSGKPGGDVADPYDDGLGEN